MAIGVAHNGSLAPLGRVAWQAAALSLARTISDRQAVRGGANVPAPRDECRSAATAANAAGMTADNASRVSGLWSFSDIEALDCHP